MGKFFNNSYFKTYITLLISMFSIEIIFRLVSGINLFDISLLRVFLGLNVIICLISFLLNYCNNIIKKIVTLVVILAHGIYACLQMGFYNFLGVYMSFQTSSQLGAVVDYIKDFIASFNISYFATLIPFVISLILVIVLRNKGERKIRHKWAFLSTFIVFMISVPVYAFTVISPRFDDKLQSVKNSELFLTASNPSVTVKQFGTLGFCFLDIKAMLFPVVIEEEYIFEQIVKNDKNEFSRDIDDTAWNILINNESNDKLNKLNKYFINQNIDDKNEYTGMFEGKNLIVIMMESVNDIFLDAEYYPNFNKLVSEGWYWENNYSPRNSCATMNNEFSGMTSLYSIYNTCTASKFKDNTYYESIFNLYNRHNYVTFSAHNYTEAYYPRKKIHTNMGSGEYYGVQKLKIPYENEYRNWSSDKDFMEKMLTIIDDKTKDGEPFMTWLTTVSSHQPYSVDSNEGNKYYNMTKSTKYPTDVRRYMSKLKILDDGLGVLLEGLESRGILDDTVIVLYGDHYPYGISTKKLNKVLDYDTAEDLNAERVPFVIYNSQMEESKVFSDYTSYINILPTIANLFNLDYDPRLYVGDDLLSKDYQSLVVFADGSWKNEYAFYNASKNKIKYYSSNELTQEEIKKINDSIDTKINISRDVIKSNYFEYLGKELEAIKEELELQKNSMCLNSEKDEYLMEETTTQVVE